MPPPAPRRASPRAGVLGVLALTLLARGSAAHEENAPDSRLSSAFDAGAPGADGQPPLFAAAISGDVGSIDFLLRAGASASAVDAKTGATPLHRAAHRGHTAAVRALVAGGAPLDARDKALATPMMWAAAEGHSDVVEALAAAGADVEAADGDGDTALIRASVFGRGAAVAALIGAGAAPARANNKGADALFHATFFNHAPIADLLRAAIAEAGERASAASPEVEL